MRVPQRPKALSHRLASTYLLMSVGGVLPMIFMFSPACRIAAMSSTPLRQVPGYLIAWGLMGDPTARVIGRGGATNMNS